MILYGFSVLGINKNISRQGAKAAKKINYSLFTIDHLLFEI